MLALGVLFIAPRAFSQASTTGGIAGVVTDPTGAAVPNATVVAVNSGTGAAQTAKTDAHGNYRLQLLIPATYSLTATASGFNKAAVLAIVQLGQISDVPIKLGLAGSTQTVEVQGAAPPLLQTVNGNVANTISEAQVKAVPVPGRDMNYLAQMTPGAVNTGGGFPSLFGMPTSSNMYTLDGMQDIDPYNNGTNGGATNLLLGMNDVQEATTVSNGYSAKYGTLAGANINIISKSGSNNWHGNAIWDWNGDKLNGNNFFNNALGTPRPVSIANQWAGSLGGPILHNKLFFFADDEGLAVVLPSSTLTQIPSPQFEAATLANLAASAPNSVPFYQKMFDLYNGAAGASRATAVPGGGCMGLNVTAGAPCALQFQSNANNFAWENIVVAKVDYNISQSDHAYFHWELDRGVQATGTDPINPLFNSESNQPMFQGQGFWSHTFGAGAVNALTVAVQHYTAFFGPADLNASMAAFPGEMDFNDGSLTSLGGGDGGLFGRSVANIQISDDFDKTIGAHSFDFGFTGNKYYANTLLGTNINGDFSTTLPAFYYGGVDTADPSQVTSYAKNFPKSPKVPLRSMRIGVYADDQWQVQPNLSVTLALRVDNPSSPWCATNCFASMGDFLTASHDGNAPYNAAIQLGLKDAIPNLQSLEWQPRFGFAWQPRGTGVGTVVRGGFGVFADNTPISLATGFLANLPLNPGFNFSNQMISPDESTNLIASTNAAYTALVSGFANGATFAQLQAAVPGFSAPALTSVASPLQNAFYYKYNVEVQQSLWTNSAMTVGYNGNIGLDELMLNPAVNAYSPSFVGLPTAPLDPRFGKVTYYQSNGRSNYNGLTTVFHDNFGEGVLQLSYTWSHALDYGFGTGQIRTVAYPNDMGALYGPADQDARHVFNANYLWNVPFQKWFGGSKAVAGGWQVSGTFMARTGLPYSITDSSVASKLGTTGYASTTPILDNFLGGAVGTCDSPDTPCLLKSQFTRATGGFGDQQRNMFRAPGFWDTDMSVQKSIGIPGWESGQFQIKGSAYNLFNHPNFGTPNRTLTSSHFGNITGTAQMASSILGNNGGDASARLVQLEVGISW